MSLYARLLALASVVVSVPFPVCSALSPLAIDVQLTSDGAVVAESSRPTFDPNGPAGWRMIDRFHAFRYELALSSDTIDASIDVLMNDVASLAREQHCFGWIQQTTSRHVAGELRCPKTHTSTVQTRLETTPGTLSIKTYANTKIRYHFPTFRVLTEPRYVGKTCFSTPPHACGN